MSILLLSSLPASLSLIFKQLIHYFSQTKVGIFCNTFYFIEAPILALIYPSKPFHFQLIFVKKIKNIKCSVSSLFCSFPLSLTFQLWIMQMSSSSVCQGLQSCLEPLLIEPRGLRLTLAPPGPSLPRTTGWPNRASLSPSDSSTKQTLTHTTASNPARTNDERDMKMDKTADIGGWSFLQSLFADSSHCKKTEDPVTDKVYVHPTVKRSSSMLSAKSLEMCTENLGSESGSDTTEKSDDIALISFETSNTSFTRHAHEASRNCVFKRLDRNCSFPPPLTSITDLGGIQVWPHREDGRLVMKAVAIPSPPPYFEAERTNGRLRLRLFETIASDSEDEEAVADDEETGEEERNGEEEAENFNQKACGEEGAETGKGRCCEDLEEINDNAEDEMGMRNFPRPSRCNESRNRNQEILKWEPYCVAT